jgi:hypothetical protein
MKKKTTLTGKAFIDEKTGYKWKLVRWVRTLYFFARTSSVAFIWFRVWMKTSNRGSMLEHWSLPGDRKLRMCWKCPRGGVFSVGLIRVAKKWRSEIVSLKVSKITLCWGISRRTSPTVDLVISGKMWFNSYRFTFQNVFDEKVVWAYIRNEEVSWSLFAGRQIGEEERWILCTKEWKDCHIAGYILPLDVIHGEGW